MGFRRHIRAVGLQNDLGKRCIFHHLFQFSGILKRNNAPYSQIKPHLQVFSCNFFTVGKTVYNSTVHSIFHILPHNFQCILSSITAVNHKRKLFLSGYFHLCPELFLLYTMFFFFFMPVIIQSYFSYSHCFFMAGKPSDFIQNSICDLIRIIRMNPHSTIYIWIFFHQINCSLQFIHRCTDINHITDPLFRKQCQEFLSVLLKRTGIIMSMSIKYHIISPLFLFSGAVSCFPCHDLNAMSKGIYNVFQAFSYCLWAAWKIDNQCFITDSR